MSRSSPRVNRPQVGHLSLSFSSSRGLSLGGGSRILSSRRSSDMSESPSSPYDRPPLYPPKSWQDSTVTRPLDGEDAPGADVHLARPRGDAVGVDVDLGRARRPTHQATREHAPVDDAREAAKVAGAVKEPSSPSSHSSSLPSWEPSLSLSLSLSESDVPVVPRPQLSQPGPGYRGSLPRSSECSRTQRTAVR